MREHVELTAPTKRLLNPAGRHARLELGGRDVDRQAAFLQESTQTECVSQQEAARLRAVGEGIRTRRGGGRRGRRLLPRVEARVVAAPDRTIPEGGTVAGPGSSACPNADPPKSIDHERITARQDPGATSRRTPIGTPQ